MSQQQTDLDRVSRVVDVADLVADAEESEPEDVLMAALSKVRRRGANDE